MSRGAGAQTLPTLKERYRAVRDRMSQAALRSGRRPEDIMLVAVTKFAEPEEIRELIELGHADFGESKVQNLVRRVAAVEEFVERHRTMTSSRKVSLPDKIRWHMIGHLQRNKVKRALEVATLIHSIDTLRLAEEIQDAAIKRDEVVEILLQVNASEERSKQGVALPAVSHLAELIETMIHLRLRGLMTMAPMTDDQSVIRSTFERCYDTFDEIRRSGVVDKDFNLLSMGMSNDFELAIECGANIVRVGTAIFGERTIAPEDESDSD